MPRVIRKSVDQSHGHCFPPRVSKTGNAKQVFAEGRLIVHEGLDYAQVHWCGKSAHSMGPAIEGSPDVFVDGKPLHRKGDAISCGDKASNGAVTVFANG